MQAYECVSGGQLASLKRAERPGREPGPGEVRVRVRAVSLNYRDLMVLAGAYPQASDKPLIPACDSAGEVMSVGAGVTTFKAGDRVANTYFAAW
jgi:NADPH:quinone reductase-like Zn-dependent oxidoreductase